MRYTLDSMLPEQAFRKLGKHLQTLEGGSPSTPPPSNTTVQNTNIPEYAQPYVENMLGAAQTQMYDKNADGTLGSLQAYKPYSTNPSDYVAGFSPMQNQAMQGTAGLQTPGQFGQASGLAGASGMGSLSMAGNLANTGNQYNQMATNPYATQAFMNPYVQASLTPQLEEMRRQYGITGTQQMGNATKQGAMGGSREALMAAENQRNMGTAMNQAIGTGYNNAFQAAQQAQQYGANLGLQGGQAALQGLGQASTAAGQLGQLGTQQLGAQQNILGAQNTMGQQQQTQQQNIMNQAIQNYATAQQYPLMQLGTMSNLLRGLPMQSTSTQQYQATPSALTTGLGTMGALGSLAMAAPKAEGGVIKGYAKGGITSFDVGGSVRAEIAGLPTKSLIQILNTTQSPTIKAEAQAELSDRAQGGLPEMAGGGIIAFKAGDVVDATKSFVDPFGSETGQTGAQALGVPEAVGGAWDRLKEGAWKSVWANNQPKEYAPEIVPSKQASAEAKGIEQAAIDAAAKPEVAAKPAWTEEQLGSIAQGSGAGAAPTAGKRPEYKSVTEAEITAASPWSQKILAAGVPEGQKEQTQAEYVKEKMDFVAKSSTNPDTQKIIDQYKDKIDGAKTAADQNFWLHASAGFAKMATLSGPTLAAAMAALGDEIPKYVTDKTMQEKLLTENQRAMYEITQAELARKNNDYAAFKVHNDNAKKTALELFLKASEEHDRTAKMMQEERTQQFQGDVKMRDTDVTAASARAQLNKPSEFTLMQRAFTANPDAFAEMFGAKSGLGTKAEQKATADALKQANKLYADYLGGKNISAPEGLSREAFLAQYGGVGSANTLPEGAAFVGSRAK
jgi:hypothetical protein